jgi:hypothetical protein
MNELTSDASRLPGFLRLPDDELLLALCVREENLADPKKWCEERRQHYLASLKPNLTVADVERLQEWSGRLAMEAAGDVAQQPSGPQGD